MSHELALTHLTKSAWHVRLVTSTIHRDGKYGLMKRNTDLIQDLSHVGLVGLRGRP
jgi:hypothetical protein